MREYGGPSAYLRRFVSARLVNPIGDCTLSASRHRAPWGLELLLWARQPTWLGRALVEANVPGVPYGANCETGRVEA